jgi:predicted amidohydrolase YtcJ
MNEMIIYGGTVLTLDPARPRAEAVLIRRNRIARVGSSAELFAAASQPGSGAAPTTIDLQGRTLIPGFIDAHIHLANLGMREMQVNIMGLSKPEILDRLREAETELGPREPLLAFGWDYDDCPHPHKDDLDAVFPHRPVILIQFSGHGAWVNSAALRHLKISESSADWEMGGADKGARGDFNGILREPGNNPAVQRIWFRQMRDPKANREGLRIAMRRMAEHGITSVQDNTWWPQAVSQIARLHREGEQTCRMSCWSLGKVRLMDLWFSLKRFKDQWYTRGPRKYFWDGAFSSHTAWLSEPYADRPESYGHGVGPDEIAPLLKRAVRQGRQVAAHSIGDAATSAYCDALERFSDDPRAMGLRFRIEHGQLIADRDFDRIKRLGMIVSAQPHAAADPQKDERLLGPERAHRAYPFRSLLDAGVPLAFGSDYPGEGTYDPLYGIHLAVNRDGGEAITAEEALACYTAGGAYAEWKENEKGRIKDGFLADLAILSEDPTSVSAETIKDIVVDATIVDGRIVYRREGADE